MKYILTAAVVAVLCVGAWAQDEAPVMPANVLTLSTTVTNDYVTPIGTHTGRTSFQGDLMYSRFFGQRGQNQMYAGLWGALGANGGDEYDVYAGVLYDTGGGVFNAEILVYNIEPVTLGPTAGDAFELGVRHLWRPGDGWLVGVGGRYVQPHDIALRGAPILYGEAQYQLTVAARTELTFRQRLGHDFGVYGFPQDSLSNSRVTVSHAFDQYGATEVSGYIDGSGTLWGDAPRGYYVSAGVSFSQSFGF